MSDLPAVIDIDTIKRMRLSGRRAEADALLKAYHDSLRENRERVKREAARIAQAKERFLKGACGLCAYPGCESARVLDCRFCESHLEYYRENARKRKEASRE